MNLPDDWVLATGQSHSVREFLTLAFNSVDMNWEEHVETSSMHERPNEVNHLLGDSHKGSKSTWMETKNKLRRFSQNDG